MMRRLCQNIMLRRMAVSLGALSVVALVAGCQHGAGNAPVKAGPPMSADSFAALELAGRLVTGAGVPRDPVAAAEIVERSAESGDATAADLLGHFYENGIGVPHDMQKAAEWLQRGADGGDLNAAVDLAYMSARGIGIAQDPARALQYAKALSAAGNPEGDNVMGLLYAAGEGVGKDPDKARRLWRGTADQRSASAMVFLGGLYRDGDGVAPDKVTAYAWFDLATENTKSNPERDLAAKSRDELALVLLPNELALGRRMAAAWKPGEDVAALRTDAPASVTAVESVSPPTSSPRPVTASAAAANQPIVAKLMTQDITVNADGTSVAVNHMQVQATNEAAARKIGEQQLYYIASRNEVEVVEAYTLKSDGRKLPVAPTAIHIQSPPGSSDMAMFDDRKMKVVVFPDVEAGDTVVLTSRYTDKPALPGNFTLFNLVNRTQPQLEWRLTITAPSAMPLAVETHDPRLRQARGRGQDGL